VDGGTEAVAEFGQGGIGLLADEDDEAVALRRVHFDAACAAAGSGREGAGGASALEQAANPSGGNAEEGGQLLAGAGVLIAGADHPLTEVLGVGLHMSLYAAVATNGCEAL
jgi:hypothetical protein